MLNPRTIRVFLLGSLFVFSLLLFETWEFTFPQKKTLSPPTQRIVVLLPSYLDIVSAYQASEQVVGVTEEVPIRDHRWSHLPRLGTSIHPDFQRTKLLAPSVLLGMPPSWDQRLDTTSTSYVSGIPFAHNRFELYQLYRQVGISLGKSTKDINTLITQTENSWLATQKHLLPMHSPKPRVLVLYPDSQGALYVLGTDSLENELLEASHAQNGWEGPSPQGPVSAKMIYSLQPEWLVTDETQTLALLQHPQLQDLPALQHRQVVGLPSHKFFSPQRAQLVYQLALAWMKLTF